MAENIMPVEKLVIIVRTAIAMQIGAQLWETNDNNLFV